MAFIVIPPADVDQGSVVDESLMSGKVKNDLDDLNARTIALEALSGGGSVASSNAEDLFAEIIAGGKDNVSDFWKVRHHPMMNTTGKGVDSEGEDIEQKEVFDRFFHDPNFTIVSAMNVSANFYLTNAFYIEQNEQLQFKIKKGENFFCLGTELHVGAASVWRVYVDGVNVNTLGLVDENGDVVPSSYSTNNATTKFGKTFHFYGLDGDEHVVTIKNENALAQEINLTFVDVGYKSVDYAIDHTIKLDAGVADVGGITAEFTEGEFSFAKPTEGLANGYTGMLKVNQAGAVTAVNGLSPAATQLKPDETVAFSSPVTTMKVKNNFAFPSSGGICLFQHPDGESYLFSYGGKSEPSPANHSLDSIIWQSQPTEDFKPLIPAAGATYVVNEWRGDGRIEYWAKAPIQIDGTNNKVDFEININGVTTNHTATIASGFYSADLIPLSKAFRLAMRTSKPLPVSAEYFLDYNKKSQLWSVGVSGSDEIITIAFKWATGANSGTSFGPVLGFSSDSTGERTYVSPLIKQHLAQKVFHPDQNLRSAEHPSIKYSWSITTGVKIAEADSLLETAGLSSYRRQDAATVPAVFIIYPDEDACGMNLMFMREDIGMYLTYQIDDGDMTYLVQTSRPNDVGNPTKGALMHSFISFPKGSRKITVKAELNVWFEIESSTQFVTFFGYRQFFSKPPWETLTPQEKILKTFEINPLRLLCTAYGHNTALYSTQPSGDNLNALTESGVWTQTTNTGMWNQRDRRSATNGGFIDIEFVLQGDGGGVGIRQLHTTSSSREISYYLAAGTTITEATDLVERGSYDWHSALFKVDTMHIGLKAGTYTLRVKNDDTQTIFNNAIIVIDTVAPDPNKRTHSEISNTGQSVPYPLHARRRNMDRYAAMNQPSFYPEGSFKLGIVHHADYSALTHTIIKRDEDTNLKEEIDLWWSSMNLTNISDYVQYRTFCRSLSAQISTLSSYSTVVQPNLDGRNLNTISARENCKGGLAPSATRTDSCVINFNDFEWPATFNAGLVYNMGDTRGLRTGQKAILVDNVGATEEVYIDSFVVDTSFTIKKALTTLTPANVVKIQLWGFHNLKLTSVDAVDWYMNAFVFEPLPIERSILNSRVQSETREEIIESTQSLPSAASIVGKLSYQRFDYPIHSDGEEATPRTSEIIQLNNGSSSSAYLERGLKAFRGTVIATAVAARVITIKSRKDISIFASPVIRG